jgi:prophage antirepressor-like protein
MSLATFDFNEAPVRVMMRDEQPWFVAADVCRVLEISNSRDAVSGLDDDEKATVGNTDSRPGQPGAKSFQIISESGLYALVFKSRKPEAKTFRKWVTAEVLPALRQTGRYEAPVDMVLPRVRTVKDQVMDLRALLLGSAQAVRDKLLDAGRAQQVANLSARFLETIKMEGDAIGYETLFEMRAGEGGGGLLQAEAGRPANAVQGMPQCGLQGPKSQRCGLSSAPVSGEETLGSEESQESAGASGEATVFGGAPGAVAGSGIGSDFTEAAGLATDGETFVKEVAA